MKTTPIIDRLKDQVAAFGARVAGTASLEGAAETDLAVPHAFVLALGDHAEPDALLGTATVQTVTETFRVIVCVANTSDERGQTAADRIDDLRAQILAALIGFGADGRYSRIEYLGGDFVDLDRARLWWQFDLAGITSSDLIA
ncbi:MAG: hypothetical protein JNM75_06475 [Rhodospirillales bacterium]|nr:hypothetical protein [Rhodospirillales bacterium]